MSLLKIKTLEVTGPDSDGDFEFQIDGYNETPSLYLNREQVNQLIGFLKEKH